MLNQLTTLENIHSLNKKKEESSDEEESFQFFQIPKEKGKENEKYLYK